MRQIQFQKDLQIRLLLPLLSPQVGAELEFNSEEQNRFNYVVREQHNLLKSARPKLDDAAAAGLDAVLSPEQRTQLTELVGTQLTLGPVAPLEANVPGADLRRLNTVLNHADAKRELELVGEQEEQLARLLEAIIREAGVIHDKARRAEVEAVLRKQQPTFTIEQGFVALNNKVEEELAEILLPHQCRRLKQIRLQFESHEESPIPLLTTAIARELKLSEKQRDQLRAAYIRTWERAEAEFNQQFDKALSTVLDSLTPNQKTRYLSLVGAPFSKTFQ
ncbi:MAG: hypothetical protein HYV60_10210 [Planctomycetia bacterium]|nr:hypothetical protein [Planctomycetia bacterium]